MTAYEEMVAEFNLSADRLRSSSMSASERRFRIRVLRITTMNRKSSPEEHSRMMDIQSSDSSLPKKSTSS